MSILITGMEMPHQGEFSHVRIYDNGDVTVEVDTGKEVYEAVIAHAVQIPPHGRLIDADALRAKMYHEAFETDTPMQKWDSGCWIRYKLFEMTEESAPTIIPAEEGE